MKTKVVRLTIILSINYQTICLSGTVFKKECTSIKLFLPLVVLNSDRILFTRDSEINSIKTYDRKWLNVSFYKLLEHFSSKNIGT